MNKIALTGIKPTGTPHIGNYLGMIKPALGLVEAYRAFYFIADYHALTTVKDRSRLNQLVYEIAATWLALGLDPDRCNVFAIYRHFAPQSDVERTREKYVRGELAYSEIKKELLEILEKTFRQANEKYSALVSDQARLDRILSRGAEKARAIGAPVLRKVRRNIGIQRAG